MDDNDLYDNAFSTPIRAQPGSARQMREDAINNNPLSRIPSSNNPPRNEEENERAKSIVEKWSADLSRAIEALKKGGMSGDQVKEL